ncbi:hypothetical protein G7054_g7739 [Neopestalotiopsis clavispora]|nr:hypothetical protein G7054_g7739 [Neopestalotiopsis clavispora]
MSSRRLESLPPELLSCIGALLPQADCIKLSSINSYLRSVLGPVGFRTVTLTNSPDNNWENLRHFTDKYGQYVREVRFVGNVYKSTQIGDGRDHPAAEDDHAVDESQNTLTSLTPVATDEQTTTHLGHALLPKLIHEALSGRLFPAADTYEVSFDFGDFYDPPPDEDAWEHEDDQPVDSIWVFEQPENEEASIKEKEARYPWRRLMAAVWHVLSQNLQAKKLVAKDLMPKPTSTFFSRQWHDFLSRLQELKINMWALDNGAGWMSNTLIAYEDFIDHIGQYFFEHTTHVQSLVLAAHPECPFGYAAASHDVALPLKVGALPELRHLELYEVYVCPEIVDFVCRVNSRTTGLVLRNCHVNTAQYDGPYTWADFFEALMGNNNNALKSFVVEYDKLVSMSIPEPDQDTEIKLPNRRRVAERRVTRQIPGAIVFDHGSCSDKYGYYCQDGYKNYDYFAAGRDLSAFQSLTAHIHNVVEPREGNNGAVSYTILSDELL